MSQTPEVQHQGQYFFSVERLCERFAAHPQWRKLALGGVAAALLVFGLFAFVYIRLAHRVDVRLAEGPFSGTVDIYAAPRSVAAQGGVVKRVDARFITSLAGLEKRRLVHYSDIPPNLVHAVISAEDKHFFHHTGVDFLRLAKAAWVDFKDGRKEQGASTLSMQLARGLWLGPEKSWKRKAEELLITLHLEERLTKQQIFEYYANQVYLGRRGPFSIHGFGEGARAVFGKDLSQLTDAEAALLAGIVQRPSYFNPFRYPERARERRDLVLNLMRENGYLNKAAYTAAVNSGVNVNQELADGLEDQYFIDFMNRELEARGEEGDWQARSVYTTLDPDLQNEAEEAVRIGMAQLDTRLRKRKGYSPSQGAPQVALIALDPHTGEIKALVGGRNYADSQLNRVLAMRQPGSVFKPIVYATALETALHGGEQIFTPATILDDDPDTTFSFHGQVYQPANFGHEFMGPVTMREALAHSLNVATVSLAEQVGYDEVADMAKRLGFNDGVQATPALALGAYDVTPMEVAGAYTAFANHGVRVSPTAISMVRAADGSVLYRHEPDPQAVLDPRVAYLMVNLMQEVLRSGTGAAVRGRGFNLPAAGKTGTSRDGWFAGFTSNLECVVWVGFDDGRDLNLEGAHSALPIWAEFMKRAAKLPGYHDVTSFKAPSGIVSAEICPDSGELAGATCPDARQEFFIRGSEPTAECQLHSVVAGDPNAASPSHPTPVALQTVDH